MKIGLIFECGPMGADKQVCEFLAKKLKPADSFVCKTLDNKDALLNDAANVAKGLFEIEACDRVLIIWDLRPSWPDMKQKPCRNAERQKLLAEIQAQGIAAKQVYLVCIEQELESWLLADHDAINAFLSTPAHRCSIATKVKRPDAENNPKSRMMNYFKQGRGLRYDDRVHAIRVIQQECLDISKLRKSASFTRFEAKLH
jgi:hypothetical protein